MCFGLEEFVAEVNVFDSPLFGREAARKLFQLREASHHAVDFRMLAGKCLEPEIAV
jgi:hypothetical protein